MRFLVRILPFQGDYSAMVPDLPGCVAAGDSVEQVRELIADAIVLHLELMVKEGARLPKPRSRVNLNLDELEDGELCTWIEIKKPRAVAVSERL